MHDLLEGPQSPSYGSFLTNANRVIMNQPTIRQVSLFLTIHTASCCLLVNSYLDVLIGKYSFDTVPVTGPLFESFPKFAYDVI